MEVEMRVEPAVKVYEQIFYHRLILRCTQTVYWNILSKKQAQNYSKVKTFNEEVISVS